MLVQRWKLVPSNDRPNRFYSKRQENKVAGIVNGNPTPNSGATLFGKGDVTAKLLLTECKTLKTPQKSHAIKKEWLEKIEEEAFSRGYHISALAFDYGDGGHQYFAVRDDTFKLLYEAWLEINEGGS